MKPQLLMISFLLTGMQLTGQFEQKLSLNLSAGPFNTIGYRDYLPEGYPSSGPYEPTLMANFRTGFSLSAGIQYNFSRHLSVEASFGRMASNRWYFDYSDDGADPFNYLYYEIYTDTVTYNIEVSGENELYLSAWYGSIAPRYYFRPGRKLNPYLLAGINATYIDVHFENNEYSDYLELGREGEYGSSSAGAWHGYGTHLGCIIGTGAEYAIMDRLGLYLQARYHLALLGEYDYTDEPIYAEFHSIELHLGVRVSFVKSREL